MKSRDPLKSVFYWAPRTGYPILAKTDQEEMLRALPLFQMGISGQ